MRLFVVGLFFLSSIHGYSGDDFNSDPSTWSDSKVRSFMFLAQLQKKLNLQKSSDLCLDIEPSSDSTPGQIRVISKSGLFKTGICELEGGYNQSFDQLKTVVQSVASYQDALKNYPDMATGSVTAEVIGRTDGQKIQGTPSCSLDSTKSKKFSNNLALGEYRARYLTEQLDLKKLFNNQVNAKSITSEDQLANTPYKDCQSWRTAEVKFNFNVGGPTQKSVGGWEPAVKKTSAELQNILQIEATRTALKQYREKLSSALLNPTDSTVKDGLCRDVSANLLKFVSAAESKAESLAPTQLEVVSYSAGCAYRYSRLDRSTGKYTPQIISLPFTALATSTSPGVVFKTPQLNPPIDPTKPGNKDFLQAFNNSVNSQALVKGSETLKKIRLDSIRQGSVDEKGVPSCDGKVLLQADQYLSELLESPMIVNPDSYEGRSAAILNRVYDDSPITPEDIRSVKDSRFYRDLVSKTMESVNSSGQWDRHDGSGRSTSNLKCFSVKKAANAIFKESNCRASTDFSSAKFPYPNLDMRCQGCHSGICSLGKDGVLSASNREAPSDYKKENLSHNHGSVNPSYSNFLGPQLIEIEDCPNCICGDKSKKKMNTIPVMSTALNSPDVLSGRQRKDSSCFCSTPIAAACGVAPDGTKDDEKIAPSVQSTQYFDLCDGAFKTVSISMSQVPDMKSVISKFVGHDCSAQSSSKVGEQGSGKVQVGVSCSAEQSFESIRQSVANMTCKAQGFVAPTNDPLADCKK